MKVKSPSVFLFPPPWHAVFVRCTTCPRIYWPIFARGLNAVIIKLLDRSAASVLTRQLQRHFEVFSLCGRKRGRQHFCITLPACMTISENLPALLCCVARIQRRVISKLIWVTGDIWCQQRSGAFLNVTFSTFWWCWGFLNGTALMVCD